MIFAAASSLNISKPSEPERLDVKKNAILCVAFAAAKPDAVDCVGEIVGVIVRVCVNVGEGVTVAVAEVLAVDDAGDAVGVLDTVGDRVRVADADGAAHVATTTALPAEPLFCAAATVPYVMALASAARDAFM